MSQTQTTNITGSNKEAFTNDKGDFNIEIQPYDNTSPDLNNPAADNEQIVNITGQVTGMTQDYTGEEKIEGIYNVLVYTADDFEGTLPKNPTRTKTDTDGNFAMSVPKSTKFISARIKSQASNADNDDYFVSSVDFTPNKTNYNLQLSLQKYEDITINVSKDLSLDPLPPTLLITAEGYESKEIIPYKGDGTPKTDIGDIELTPINKSLENDIITSSQLSEESIKSMTSSKKTADYYIMKRLLDVINNLKGTLIPIILGLLSKFGITNVQGLIGKGEDEIKDKLKDIITCPPQNQLSLIIRKKNKLVKALNNALKVIDATTKALGIVGGVIMSIEISFNLLAFIPVPINPAVPIALTKLERIIGKLKAGNTGLLALLVLLQQTISMVINMLNILDIALENCTPDNEEEQESLNQELLDLIKEAQTQDNSSVIKIVNGFTMDLETEKTENPLKRKRSIAKNADNVTILKGEWSFSSIDQILIDELVFYIQNNNLKAD